MQKLIFAAVAATLSITSNQALAGEEHRQLGPHVHGHGKLNIAIEGKRVSMELEVPGADIVGFEHEASTPAQKATIKKAKGTLADALSLFQLPTAASCTLADAKVAIRAGDHEHEEAAGHEGEEEHHHSEFHVTYAIDCAAPDKLTGIDFKYFDAFAGAQELDVNLVTEKAQTHYEVKHGQPKLELGEIG